MKAASLLMPIIRGNDRPQMFSGSFSSMPQCRGDVQDLGCSVFVCEKDMNRDFHPHAQCDGSQDQGTMEVDDECLAFTPQRFAHTLSLNPNFQAETHSPRSIGRSAR